MANEEHLARLRAGADAWNAWREEHPDFTPDLRDANLRGANLRGANLREANLRAANLSEADLVGADLREANFRGANLSEAHLVEANLMKANLSEANLSEANLSEANLVWTNLSEANLSEANLNRAHLEGADLTKAHLNETIFVNIDLSATKGLDACTHGGPSILDHRTLQRSGCLPLPFLRGCGLPDRLIDYLPSQGCSVLLTPAGMTTHDVG